MTLVRLKCAKEPNQNVNNEIFQLMKVHVALIYLREKYFNFITCSQKQPE